MVSVTGTRNRHDHAALKPAKAEGADGPGKSGQSVGHMAKAALAAGLDLGIEEGAANAMGQAAAKIAKMTFDQRAALFAPPPDPVVPPTDGATDTTGEPDTTTDGGTGATDTSGGTDTTGTTGGTDTTGATDGTATPGSTEEADTTGTTDGTDATDATGSSDASGATGGAGSADTGTTDVQADASAALEANIAANTASVLELLEQAAEAAESA